MNFVELYLDLPLKSKNRLKMDKNVLRLDQKYTRCLHADKL